MRNSGARDGDRLILTKGLGVGVFSAALKQGRLDGAGYGTMIGSTTQLNALGARLPSIDGVHAVTDVTGFGLLGHALEMCRGAGLRATLRMADVPLLAGAAELARSGLRTGAATRNWASYGEAVDLSPELVEWQRDLLCDPQTSGGLLVAAAPEAAEAVLDLARRDKFGLAAIVGEIRTGPARVNML
jgi:selenide,water dikinase